MGRFEGVTIIMGAVTETDSLRETVRILSVTCSHEDIKEVRLGYSPHATPESMKVVNELSTATEYGFPIVVFGQTRPRMKGIAEAIDAAEGSHCILISSDLAEDLSGISQMIEGAKADGETIVSLSRWLKGCKFFGYGKAKRVLNCFGQLFIRLLYRTKLTDLTNPVQIVPTEVYRSINWEYEDFRFLLEMVLKPLRLGCKFREIPTNCYARRQGKSSNSAGQVLSYLFAAIHIRFMKKEMLLKDGCK